MHSRFVLALGIAILAPTGTALAPQQPDQHRAQPAPALVSIHELTGVKVVFAASIARPKLPGQRAQPPRVAGTLQDFVIDCRTRKIVFAAVATTGAKARTRTVAIDKLAWRDTAGDWVIALTEAELQVQPHLPYKDLDGTQSGSTAPAPPNWHCLATKMLRAPITAAGKAAGTVTDLLVERRTKAAAFVKVAVAGRSHAVPFPVLRIKPKAGVTKVPAVDLEITLKRLRAAPELAAGRSSGLRKRTFRNRVYQHFGVAMPDFEPRVVVTEQPAPQPKR